VVAATDSLAPVEPDPVDPVPVEVVEPPPVENGYQAIERLLNDEPELDVEDEVDVRGVGVGPPIGVSSSGSVIGVSGFRRRIGSPLWGISRVSSVPWASFIRLVRPWFQVAAPVGLRQVSPYTPWASRVIEPGETGYVPGVAGNPSRISWFSGGIAGTSMSGAPPDDDPDEQAASEAASKSAAATRTEGSALRRR
jgi:hypothetical protein